MREERRVKSTKRATVGMAIVAALLLAVPASASAAKATHKLTGKMVDEANSTTDANSKVSVKVVVKNGEPKRLKALKFDNLNGYCRDEMDGPLYFVNEFSGRGGRNLNRRIEINNIFNWFSNPETPSRRVEFYGKIKNSGKRITATLNVFNNTECSFAKGKVTLTK
jgi:hypothetical protein